LQVSVDPTVTEDVDSEVYYNMDKYNELVAQAAKEAIVVPLSSEGTFFCRNESESYPDALMISEYDGTAIPMSQEPPIGSGKYPNPVQVCMFGAISYFMHTFAIRLYAKGFKIGDFTGTLTTSMNKRKILGVEKDTRVFPNGGSIALKVTTNAPEATVNEVLEEAKKMAPSYLDMTGVKFLITKVEKA
jgi:hypothetical protein